MLSSSTAIIDASVVRPVVSFEKNWMMPVITRRITIISIGIVVHEVIVEDQAAIRGV